MKKWLLLLTIISLIVPLSIACKSTDKQLTDAVKQKLLADATLSSAKIDVRTHNRVVTLDGKVIGQEEAHRAIQLAQSVPGVVTVDSKLQIDTHITNRDIKQRVERGEKAAKEQNKEEEKHQ